MAFKISSFKSVFVLTGAGISVASGIKPFRGKDGLWNNGDNQKYSDPEYYNRNPIDVWKFWAKLRDQIKTSSPNPAHMVLAEIEHQFSSNKKFTLATQNVDGLHQKAGSQSVVELHGNLLRSKCSFRNCTSKPFLDDETDFDKLRYCEECGAVIRPDIVMFGENLLLESVKRSVEALKACDLFLAIGTSGTVSPAAEFVELACEAGAYTVYINAEPMTIRNPYFYENIYGLAENILPDLL